jgi:hypothetical protein
MPEESPFPASRRAEEVDADNLNPDQKMRLRAFIETLAREGQSERAGSQSSSVVFSREQRRQGVRVKREMGEDEDGESGTARKRARKGKRTMSQVDIDLTGDSQDEDDGEDVA